MSRAAPGPAPRTAASLLSTSLAVPILLAGCGRHEIEPPIAARPIAARHARASVAAPAAHSAAEAMAPAPGSVAATAVDADVPGAKTAGGAAGGAADSTRAGAARSGRRNAWDVPAAEPPVQAADRVYALVRGRERSYADPDAIYELYAYDVATVRKHSALLLDPGGGTFEVPGEFLIRAGARGDRLHQGDMVLAEWASSLKHAQVVDGKGVIGDKGDKIAIRYTDLPRSWAEERITALKSPRELTAQKEGFSPGNFVIADIGRRRFLGMLLVRAGHKSWLVRRFSHRVVRLPLSKLTTLPLRPKLRRRQRVLAPWVGVMYEGRVRRVVGTRVLVRIEGIGQQAPVVASLGQVLPLAPRRR